MGLICKTSNRGKSTVHSSNALVEGLEFDSYESLKRYLEKYQDENFVQLTVADSKTIECNKSKSARNIKLKLANKDLKYSTINYKCIHGDSYKSRGTGERRTVSIKQKCPFAIKIRLTRNAQRLTVSKVVDGHNHPISKDIYNTLPRQRKLSPEDRAKVKDMLNLKFDKKLVKDYINSKLGKNVRLKDLDNLKRNRNPTEKLPSETGHFLSDAQVVNIVVPGSETESEEEWSKSDFESEEKLNKGEDIVESSDIESEEELNKAEDTVEGSDFESEEELNKAEDIVEGSDFDSEEELNKADDIVESDFESEEKLLSESELEVLINSEEELEQKELIKSEEEEVSSESEEVVLSEEKKYIEIAARCSNLFTVLCDLSTSDFYKAIKEIDALSNKFLQKKRSLQESENQATSSETAQTPSHRPVEVSVGTHLKNSSTSNMKPKRKRSLKSIQLISLKKVKKD